MKTYNEAPPIINRNGKKYFRWTTKSLLAVTNRSDELIIAKNSGVKIIERPVLGRNLKGRTDLYGNEYKPSIWLYTDKKAHYNYEHKVSSFILSKLSEPDEFYFIHVWGDVEPILSAPYPTEELRTQQARQTCLENMEDGIYKLDMINGKPVISTFHGDDSLTIFENTYEHCGETWTDTSASTNNDRCPICNAEVTPKESHELNEPAGIYCVQEPYIIIESLGGAQYAAIVTDEDGNNKTFDDLKEAKKEAKDCQDGYILYIS